MNKENTLLYFWNSSCSICEPLYDKLHLLIKSNFPLLTIEKINIADAPEFRVKYNVFSSPLIIFLLEGKEYFRSGGNVSTQEIKQKIQRLYQLKFDE